MAAYYNEIDAYCAGWLRNLIAARHVPEGDVDERDIRDVRADDLRGYTQCHFFAGIGGWSYALRLAGWPDDRPVWTGSCPCQPFSSAGKGKAFDDERHLWPAWVSLIRECKPAIVFGEQVEAAIGWGWLDLVFSDLEAEGYACGAAVLPACGVGAPHIRQRLWFVGQSNGVQPEQFARARARPDETEGCGARRQSTRPGDNGELADADPARCRAGRPREAGDGRDAPRLEPARLRTDSAVADSNGGNARTEGLQRGGQHGREPQDGCAQPVADASGDGRQDARRNGSLERGPGQEGYASQRSHASPWSNLVWLPCTDGKQRPTIAGLQPLVDGLSFRLGSGGPFAGKSRVAMLRGAGNAIVPQVAAEFVKATQEQAA